MILYRKLKAGYNLCKRNIRWKYDAKKCREELKAKRISKEIEIKGKIVVLMPHSDDEWIGCSQILKKAAHNVFVINMDMLGGDNRDVHLERRKEAENSADRFGYEFLNMDNGDNSLEMCLIKIQPDCVFLPCYLDWHDEHFKVMEIFMNVAEKIGYSGRVAMYQVSLPISISLINYGIPMDKKEWKNKWRFLKANYKTQRFLPITRFSLNEYINGGLFDCFSAEVYSVSTFSEWKLGMMNGQLSKQQINECQKHLQEIKYIRDLLNKHCEKICNERYKTI